LLIIPPPRRHLVRYAGVFGPAAKARSKLRALIPATGAGDAAARPAAGTPIPIRARRLPWADLLRRVFAEDVLTCPCGGPRSVTAFVTDQRLAPACSSPWACPRVTQRWLAHTSTPQDAVVATHSRGRSERHQRRHRP